MKHHYLPVIVISLLSFYACSDRSDNNTDIPVLNIGEALENPQTITLSQFGSKIKYIPLETTDSSLIGHNPSNLTVTDRYIIVSNSSRMGDNCLVFDRATGKFLNSVGHKGQDPNAFSGPIPVIDDATGSLTFLGNTDKMLVYNIDGNMESTIQLPTSANNINCYIFDGGNPLLYTGSAIESRQRDLLRINPEGEILDSLMVMGESTLSNRGYYSLDPSDIYSLSVVGLPNSFPGTILFIKLKSGHDRIMFQDQQTLWKTDDYIRFHEIFTDTIYTYTDNNLKPAYILDLGSKGFTINDIGTKAIEEDSPIPYYYLENSDLLVFYGKIGLFSKDHFIGIYDKNDDNLSISTLPTEGLTNDIDGFASVAPIRLTSKNEFVGTLTMDIISNWIDENPDYEFPEEIAWIKDLPEDSNPIVVIISQ